MRESPVLERSKGFVILKVLKVAVYGKLQVVDIGRTTE